MTKAKKYKQKTTMKFELNITLLFALKQKLKIQSPNKIPTTLNNIYEQITYNI